MRCFGSGWRFVVAHPAGMLTVRHFARYIDASGGCGIYYRRDSGFGRNSSQFEQRRILHRHSRLSRPQKQVTFLPYYRYLSLNAVIPDSSFGESMRSCIFFNWNHFHSSAAWNLINFDANIAFSCRHRQENMAIIILLLPYTKKNPRKRLFPRIFCIISQLADYTSSNGTSVTLSPLLLPPCWAPWLAPGWGPCCWAPACCWAL